MYISLFITSNFTAIKGKLDRHVSKPATFLKVSANLGEIVVGAKVLTWVTLTAGTPQHSWELQVVMMGEPNSQAGGITSFNLNYFAHSTN